MSKTHGLMATRLREREAELFDGTGGDTFLYALKAHVSHGYPLSQAGRRKAAKRIIASHPHLSDRAIAQIAGLGAKTVATLRERAGDHVHTVEARVGRDGRVRPLNSAAGRLRAAELIALRPHASLREVARMAGVSPATVSDVRKRLNAGLEPVPGRQAAAAEPAHTAPAARHTPRRTARPANPAAPVDTAGPAVSPEMPGPVASAELAGSLGAMDPMAANSAALLLMKLSRDPSLRQHDMGRRLLILLRSCSSGARNLNDLVDVVPPHCTTHIRQLARQVAQMWLDFAQELPQP